MIARSASLATKAEIRRKLDKLGNTPNRVAANLKRLGINGKKHNPAECPVACFLTNHFKTITAISVDMQIIRIYQREKHLEIRTPPTIARFIWLHDRGEYPFLLITRD